MLEKTTDAGSVNKPDPLERSQLRQLYDHFSNLFMIVGVDLFVDIWFGYI